MAVDMKVRVLDSSNKASDKTVSYVNPSATDVQIWNLAQAMVSLTSYEFVELSKITTETILRPTEENSNG